MVSRVCICCGEAMPDQGSARARNPNLCPACSNLAEELEDLPTLLAEPFLASLALPENNLEPLRKAA